jgi:DNA repair exonuclease SbcCD ATPase subunit
MELKKLILKNFRTHRSASFEFESGVTGIIGGNGSGKSSIVEAIIFLLTGEGYGKTKTEMLTLGQTSGYVVGHLLIDGEEAILERHVDSTKVNFKYRDKVYKKSGEVNEIWDTLFQIDKNIVQNVIVSNQGEIALLFNGDNATKEKLFQKIFMVPNTTKIRDIIWNNYIKDAPPEYPVKDTTQLSSDIQCLEQLVVMSKASLAELNIDEEDYNQLIARQAYLKNVDRSADSFSLASAGLQESQVELDKLQAAIDSLQSKMQIINIKEYRDCLASQKAALGLHENRAQVERKKSSLVKVDDPGVTNEDVKKLQQDVADLEAGLKVKRAALTDINRKIEEYEKSGLDSGVCPTCGTQVTDIVKLIAHLDAERDPIIKAGKAEKEKLGRLAGELKEASEKLLAWEEYNKELALIQSALEAYKDVPSFDNEAYELCASVVEKYTAWEAKLTGLQQQKTEELNRNNKLKLKLAETVKYDKDPSEFASEKIEVAFKISEHLKAREEAKKLEVEIAANEREIKSLKQDLADNKGYLEKNSKRKEYVAVLRNIYDLFHTGKFPRALIQTYGSTVSEYMTDVLSGFDFPYTAKVNESFGIDIFNEEGLQLPAISGGQQVMVGFSLRLALHNMFVGAFPFMIIDEGSYGLHNENAKKYFEIIKTLGKSSKFKQVIVIDHHSELSEYVDNTINL